MLDGSGSHVQTKGEYSDVIHMGFSWYCEAETITGMGSRTGYKSSDDGVDIEARNCFSNNSIEKPISRNNKLNVSNIHLIGGRTYVFKLIFQANGLVATVEHKVFVEKHTNLTFV